MEGSPAGGIIRSSQTIHCWLTRPTYLFCTRICCGVPGGRLSCPSDSLFYRSLASGSVRRRSSMPDADLTWLGSCACSGSCPAFCPFPCRCDFSWRRKAGLYTYSHMPAPTFNFCSFPQHAYKFHHFHIPHTANGAIFIPHTTHLKLLVWFHQ